MGLFSNFFKSQPSSSSIAKDRLKLAITTDRASCSPEIMEQMKNDIIEVISKYVDIDTDGLNIQVTTTEDSENAVLANIPIKGTRNFRKA